MDVAALSAAVGQIGFPAAVCFALMWTNRETVKHYERVLFEFKRTLDNNTTATNDLLRQIDRQPVRGS